MYVCSKQQIELLGLFRWGTFGFKREIHGDIRLNSWCEAYKKNLNSEHGGWGSECRDVNFLPLPEKFCMWRTHGKNLWKFLWHAHSKTGMLVPHQFFCRPFPQIRGRSSTEIVVSKHFHKSEKSFEKCVLSEMCHRSVNIENKKIHTDQLSFWPGWPDEFFWENRPKCSPIRFCLYSCITLNVIKCSQKFGIL
jgi:hypothetical protein